MCCLLFADELEIGAVSGERGRARSDRRWVVMVMGLQTATCGTLPRRARCRRLLAAAEIGWLSGQDSRMKMPMEEMASNPSRL